jgi:hypothetical protein
VTKSATTQTPNPGRLVSIDALRGFNMFWIIGGVARLSGTGGTVVLLSGVLVAQWCFLYFLYRHRIFLRV